MEDFLGDEVGFFGRIDDDGLEILGMGKEVTVCLERSDGEGSNFHGLILAERLKEEKTLLRNQLG